MIQPNLTSNPWIMLQHFCLPSILPKCALPSSLWALAHAVPGPGMLFPSMNQHFFILLGKDWSIHTEVLFSPRTWLFSLKPSSEDISIYFPVYVLNMVPSTEPLNWFSFTAEPTTFATNARPWYIVNTPEITTDCFQDLYIPEPNKSHGRITGLAHQSVCSLQWCQKTQRLVCTY